MRLPGPSAGLRPLQRASMEPAGSALTPRQAGYPPASEAQVSPHKAAAGGAGRPALPLHPGVAGAPQGEPCCLPQDPQTLRRAGPGAHLTRSVLWVRDSFSFFQNICGGGAPETRHSKRTG